MSQQGTTWGEDLRSAVLPTNLWASLLALSGQLTHNRSLFAQCRRDGDGEMDHSCSDSWATPGTAMNQPLLLPHSAHKASQAEAEHLTQKWVDDGNG